MDNIKNTNKMFLPVAILCVTAVAALVTAIAIVLVPHNKELTNPKVNTEIITNTAPAVSIEAEEVKAINNNPFAGRYVTYQGISRVEKDKPTYLINPEGNDEDVFMEFVITENGETLYSSELVEAGKGLEVNFSDFLTDGEHKVTILMNPYVLSDGNYLKCPVNNAQDITITM